MSAAEGQLREILVEQLIAEYGEDRETWTALGSARRITRALLAATAPTPDEPERVHNHPPYRPVCAERRLVDGSLRGECLRDEPGPVESWSGIAARDGWDDVPDRSIRAAATDAIAWTLIEHTMDTGDREPSGEVHAEAIATAERILAARTEATR